MKTAQNLASSKKLIVYQKAKLAAVSILANIVEGYSKDSPLEFARFLTISIGSLTELEVHYATRKSVRERRNIG